jgi:choline dehydrogenase-like flavoprotein
VRQDWRVSLPVARDLVTAVLDRLVPGDDFPSASRAGVVDWLDLHADGDHARIWSVLTPGFVALEAEAVAQFGGRSFVELSTEERDEVLATFAAGAGAGFMGAATWLAAESYYGRPGPGWDMIGYRAGPARAPQPQPGPASLVTHALGEVADAYDVIVVGAGAGGGVAACVLAEAGARVLLVDRGRWLPHAEVGDDHLHNHRLAVYGDNTPAAFDAGPRVSVSGGRERVVTASHSPGWSNNAMTVGGGTRVFGAQGWRYFPDDFRMASRYGVPDGSSLADWPITYDDLAPFYERAEWEIGVAGDASAHPARGERGRAYPLPPVATTLEAALLARGADRLGWSTGPVPLLINTVPYAGRADCVQCGQCVGFSCPTDAKNGTHNTVIPRALATGRCDLVTESAAERVETDANGRVTGVRFVDGDLARRTVRAGHVVVAAGAIESARLLLNSRSDAQPAGLGNAYDQVGRNLQGHLYVGAFGRFDEPVHDGLGPGPAIATCAFVHGNAGVIGGGMLANEFVKLPMMFWLTAQEPDAPRWGLAGKHAMRDAYLRTGEVFGPVQEIPSPASRVTLADGVVDRFGLPVARLVGEQHAETLRTAAVIRARAAEWMHASGARRLWETPIGTGLTAGQHQAGTCRMGDDAASSVTDAWGRVHGHDNLWVMDGSLHVTNGPVNPVLTILALAFRNAEKLAAS